MVGNTDSIPKYNDAVQLASYFWEIQRWYVGSVDFHKEIPRADMSTD